MAVDNGDRYKTDDVQASWSPDPAALHITIADQGNDQRPTSIVLQHPTAPFERELDLRDEAAIHLHALAYLRRALSYVGVASDDLDLDHEKAGHEVDKSTSRQLKRWLEDLEPGGDLNGKRLGWAPLSNPDEDALFASFFIEHNDEVFNEHDDEANDDAFQRTDRTLVLIASEQLSGQMQGFEFGIRIIAQVP